MSTPALNTYVVQMAERAENAAGGTTGVIPAVAPAAQMLSHDKADEESNLVLTHKSGKKYDISSLTPSNQSLFQQMMPHNDVVNMDNLMVALQAVTLAKNEDAPDDIALVKCLSQSRPAADAAAREAYKESVTITLKELGYTGVSEFVIEPLTTTIVEIVYDLEFVPTHSTKDMGPHDKFNNPSIKHNVDVAKRRHFDDEKVARVRAFMDLLRALKLWYPMLYFMDTVLFAPEIKMLENPECNFAHVVDTFKKNHPDHTMDTLEASTLGFPGTLWWLVDGMTEEERSAEFNDAKKLALLDAIRLIVRLHFDPQWGMPTGGKFFTQMCNSLKEVVNTYKICLVNKAGMSAQLPTVEKINLAFDFQDLLTVAHYHAQLNGMADLVGPGRVVAIKPDTFRNQPFWAAAYTFLWSGVHLPSVKKGINALVGMNYEHSNKTVQAPKGILDIESIATNKIIKAKKKKSKKQDGKEEKDDTKEDEGKKADE